MLKLPPATLTEDITTQLKLVPSDALKLYIKNHLHSFLLTPDSCETFLYYFQNENSTNPTSETQELLHYFTKKMIQFYPCNMSCLGMSLTIAENPQLEERLRLLMAMRDQEEKDFNRELQYCQTMTKASRYMQIYLENSPNYTPGASEALKYNYNYNYYTHQWVDDVDPKEPLRDAVFTMLFTHFASRGQMERARPFWDRLDTTKAEELALNVAAEMFAADGDTEKALELYTRSHEMDPLQGPVKFRIRELRNPLVPDDSLLAERKVNICLQTYNNARQLEQTLTSLSQSSIGSARIDILINGCSDDSFFVADNARNLFPENLITIHTLNTNIGGPAGRNWLLNSHEIQQSDYVAFLEDNVTIPHDWLSHYLTVAEQDEQIAVVGGKVLNPEENQFCCQLYRYATMARDNFFKMSIAAPQNQYDNGCYDFVRETRTVSNALHLLRTKTLLRDAPAGFDTRFSYSSVSNIDHDIILGLARNKIMYCGHVTFLHDQTEKHLGTIHGERSYGNDEANKTQLSSKHAYNTGWLQGFDSLRHDIEITSKEAETSRTVLDGRQKTLSIIHNK